MKLKSYFCICLMLLALLGSSYAGSINEGFESSTFPPTGWTTISNGGTPLWERDTDSPFLGTAAALVTYGSTNILNLDWLITPRIGSITGNDSLVFYISRYWQLTNLTWDSTYLMVSTTNTDTNSFTPILKLGINNTDTNSHTYPPRLVGSNTGGLYKRYALSLASFAGQNIYIAWKHFDNDGTGLQLDDVTIGGTITSVGNTGELPLQYVLKQNYPNPFNPSTKIAFSLPEQQQVTLKVYDLLGKEVSTLVNEVKSAGSYEVNFNASALPSGFYIYRLEAGEYRETRKMQLIK